MQTTGNKPKYSTRSGAAGVWVALLFVLTLCLGATVANAATTTPAVVVSQYSLVADFTAGGFTAGGALTGGSFAVTPANDVVVGTTYGGKPDLVNMVTGAVTTPFPASNSIGATTDAEGNLYYHLNFYYGGNGIERIPYVNGAYVTTGGGSACAGGDVVPCTITPAVNPGPFKDLEFDSNGDLFLVGTNNSSGAGATVIYEITAVNLYASPSPALVTIYSDSNAVGSIATDPWGNLYFTDALYTNQGNQIASGSWLNVLTYNGTSYAATPVQLASFTPKSGNYSDTLDAIAINSSGTVYFGNQSDGIFAFPTTSSTSLSSSYVNTNVYPVSSKGGYAIAFDHKGNLDMIAYDPVAGVSAVWKLLLNNLVVPSAGTTQTDLFVNDGSTTVAGVAMEDGKVSTEFAVAPGTGAAPANAAGSTLSILPIANSLDFTGAFTFTQTLVGERVAKMTLTTGNAGIGTVTVSGVGQGAVATLDPGVVTPYTSATLIKNPTGVAVDAADHIFVADQTAGAVYQIIAGTPTSIGSGFTTPGALALDASGNLYVADEGSNKIFKIANTSTTGGFTAGATSTVVANTVLFDGLALKTPAGLSFGPDGVLYISDKGNNRVVTYNTANGFTGFPAAGLDNPAGIAVDSAGKLYIANQTAGNVLVYAGDSVTTLSSLPGVTKPAGVAVDASGSVLIGDSASGNIVLVPNEAGTLNVADALTIEANPDSAVSLALGGSGNLYSADSVGKAIYAVQRTAASVNFGSVGTGSTSDVAFYVESAGNQPLDIPLIGSTAAPFDVVAEGASTDCGGAAFTHTIASGYDCALTAEFTAPGPNGTVSNGSTTLTFTGAQDASVNVALTGTSITATGTTPQQITFEPLTTPIAYTSTQITLYATASSLLPVTFTVTGPATISGSVAAGFKLNLTSYGTVVVTAYQLGNGTYLAAPTISWTVVVNNLGTTATPTFSLPAGPYTFIPQSTSITDATSVAAIYYTVTAGTTGTTPTTTSSVFGAALSITATETIEAFAVAPGYLPSPVATATYSINVLPPTVTVTFNSPTLTILAQQAGAIDVTVTPANGFNATVTLSVSGLPSGATSSFTPPTLALSGQAGQMSVLTISLSPSAALHRPFSPWFPETTLAFALCFFGWKKRRGVLQLLLLLAVSVAGLSLFSGCGGSSAKPTPSTVTVTATAGSVVESSTFSLTITPN
jgi:sugar lactone lactonase YvrE